MQTTTREPSQEPSQPHPPSARWLSGQQGNQKHVVHMPTPMLRDLEKYALRLSKEVSWCLRMAWNMSSAQLSETRTLQSVAQSRLLKGARQPLAVELPVPVWLHIALEAERLDRSRSWLLQRTWLLARPAFLGTSAAAG